MASKKYENGYCTIFGLAKREYDHGVTIAALMQASQQASYRITERKVI